MRKIQNSKCKMQTPIWSKQPCEEHRAIHPAPSTWQCLQFDFCILNYSRHAQFKMQHANTDSAEAAV
jgi:hypothetical protein